MSTPQQPLPAQLVVSILFAAEAAADLPSLLAELERSFGPICHQGVVSPFTQTEYYNKEMGQGLQRQFVAFAELVNRERLAEIKLIANEIEKRYSRVNGSRRFNIDPGLLTVENFVLATGKNFTHRIYLRDGIFAEVTLIYQNGGFQSLPWTYWDYAAEEVVAMLERLRRELLRQVR